MKKVFLLMVFAIFICNIGKSQMIIHGTNCTSFYLFHGGNCFQISANEMWNEWPNPGETQWSSDVKNNLVTSWIIPTDRYGNDLPDSLGIYLSCQTAKNMWGSMWVKCGPYQEYTSSSGQFITRCVNSSLSPACKITTSETIYWSDDGNFDF